MHLERRGGQSLYYRYSKIDDIRDVIYAYITLNRITQNGIVRILT